MRTIPFTEKTAADFVADTKAETTQVVTAPAAEAKPETTAPAQPATDNRQPATALQKYGWLIVVALLLAAAWFFNKYKLVPKIAIPVA